MFRDARHSCAISALFISILALAISVSSLNERDDTIVLAARVTPAVVAIECKVPSEESPFLVSQDGSGVIVDSSGVVVTNFHIVKQAMSIKVTLYNGQSVPARVVGTDKTADLAVLRLVGVSRLPYLPIGRAEALRVGQRVVSLGNAHNLGASGEPSLTLGVLGGKHRRFGKSEWYEMDAQIYPGNSGGPVCDMSGEVVGINVALSSHMKSFFVPLDAERRDILRGISGGVIGG